MAAARLEGIYARLGVEPEDEARVEVNALRRGLKAVGQAAEYASFRDWRRYMIPCRVCSTT